MPRIRVWAASLLLALIGLGLAWSGFAAPVPLPVVTGAPAALAQSTNFTLEGKITRVSPGQLTVSTEGNIIFRVRFDDKTEIKRQDGSKGSAKDLRIGVKVRVEGDLTESGEIVAQKIELEENSAPEKHSSSRDSPHLSQRQEIELPSSAFLERLSVDEAGDRHIPERDAV
jgi:uncharacterized iron-regulated membrane protein